MRYLNSGHLLLFPLCVVLLCLAGGFAGGTLPLHWLCLRHTSLSLLICMGRGDCSRRCVRRVAAAAGTGIEVVATLDLDDQGSRWLSTSVYGGVYSFLSEKVFWWGSLNGAGISLYPARVRHAFISVKYIAHTYYIIFSKQIIYIIILVSTDPN